ncbi:MAG: AAA family ATPase [Lachnospiraceae bacterium]
MYKYPFHSDFKEIRKRPDFVDRTEALEKLWAKSKFQCGLRGCGKSSFLSMAAYCLDKKENADDIFAGTYIATTDWYRENKNQYPVIALSFRDSQAEKYGQAIAYLGQKMQQVYHRFMPELLDREMLRDTEYGFRRAKQYRDDAARILLGTADEADIRSSLRNLVSALERPCILIDDFHCIFEMANRYGYEEEIEAFMQEWFGDVYDLEDSTSYILVMEEPYETQTRFFFGAAEVNYDEPKSPFFTPKKQGTSDAYLQTFFLEENDLQMFFESKQLDLREEYEFAKEKLEREYREQKEKLIAYREQQSTCRESFAETINYHSKFAGVLRLPPLPKNENYRVRNEFLQDLYQVFRKNLGDSEAVYRALTHWQKGSNQTNEFLENLCSECKKNEKDNWLTRRMKDCPTEWDTDVYYTYTGNGLELHISTVERKESIFFSDPYYCKLYLSPKNTDRCEMFLEVLEWMLQNCRYRFAVIVFKDQRDDAICCWVRQEDLPVMDAFAEKQKEKLSKSCLFLAYRGMLGLSRDSACRSHMEMHAVMFTSYFRFVEMTERTVELYDAYQFMIDRWNGKYDTPNTLNDRKYDELDLQMLLILLETLESVILDREVKGDHFLLMKETKLWRKMRNCFRRATWKEREKSLCRE